MGYAKTMNRITREFDPTTEIGCKEAFLKCVEYADTKLSKSVHYNAFV
jgi:hypothetical protein